jgi:hypothetical protein
MHFEDGTWGGARTDLSVVMANSTSACAGESTVKVVAYASDCHWACKRQPARTGSRMLVINLPASAQKRILYQSVSVQPGSSCRFRIAPSNVCGPPDPSVSIKISDAGQRQTIGNSGPLPVTTANGNWTLLECIREAPVGIDAAAVEV